MARKNATNTAGDELSGMTHEELIANLDAIARNINDNERNQPQRFGSLVKRLRKNKGLSIRDVEEATALSASYLYQIERGIRNVPSVNTIILLSKIYDVPFASLMAAAKYVDPEDAVLFYDQLKRAFQFVCQDKRFKYSPIVDETAVPDDVKRFVVEMYQSFTGLRILEQVDDQVEMRRRARSKIREDSVDQDDDCPASGPTEGEL